MSRMIGRGRGGLGLGIRLFVSSAVGSREEDKMVPSDGGY
jgi:hypothetical protein